MKCKLLIVIIVLLLTFTACQGAPPPEKSTLPPAEQPDEEFVLHKTENLPADLTEQGLQELYKASGREMVYYQAANDAAFVLVKEPYASGEWWNAEFIDASGEIYEIPRGFFHMPDSISFEDIYRLEVIGDIGEASYMDADFPERTLFLRLATGEYYEHREPYWAPLDEENMIGSPSYEFYGATLENVWFTSTGVELSYGALPDEILAFNSGYVAIPTHEFAYDNENRRLLVTVYNAQHQPEQDTLANDMFCAVTAAHIRQASNKLEITLDLNDRVTAYNVSTHNHNFIWPTDQITASGRADVYINFQ